MKVFSCELQKERMNIAFYRTCKTDPNNLSNWKSEKITYHRDIGPGTGSHEGLQPSAFPVKQCVSKVCIDLYLVLSYEGFGHHRFLQLVAEKRHIKNMYFFLVYFTICVLD